MKKSIYILLVFSIIAMPSCKKSLEETPLDFYSPENSYTNKSQFESALAGIYLSIRTDFYANNDEAVNYDMLGMDLDLAHFESNTSATKKQHFGWANMNKD